MPPTVVILDDHPLVRESVVATLTSAIPGVIVAYSGPTFTDALKIISTGVRCCAVLDLDLGDDRSPVESVAGLSNLGIPTILISAEDQPSLVQKAILNGAKAYVPKRAIAEQLPAAVLAVEAGIPFRSADFAAILVPSGNGPRLLNSANERALVLHAAGLPLPAIGQRLNITAAEVERLLDSVWFAYGL